MTFSYSASSCVKSLLSVQRSWINIKAMSAHYFNWVILKCDLRLACLRNANPAICELWVASLVIWVLWYTIYPVCELRAVSSETYSELSPNIEDGALLPLESIVSLSVGSCISLNYIKSVLSVYIIPGLHIRQSKIIKAIQYIPLSNNNS